jgi:hypothetical protein
MAGMRKAAVGYWRFAAAMVAVLAIGLTSCSQKALLEKATLPQDRALATTVIHDLQASPAGDTDLKSRMAPEVAAKLGPVLPRMLAALPADRHAPSRLVGANFRIMESDGRSTRTSMLVYEIDSDTAHALVRVEITRQDNAPQITSLYVNQLDKTIEQLTAFSLDGRSPGAYLILALAVLSFLTIITSEVVLFRTKWIRLKWLWAIGCLLGFIQISVNWSNGAVSIQPITVQLLGAFAVRADLLTPWQIGFGIPIPSIAFLLLRKRLQKPPASTGSGEAAVATF